MRVNGAGRIEKRGKNTWRIRFNIGRDRVSGRYRFSPWRTVHGNKSDAQHELEKYRNELESGWRMDSQDMTFSEFAELMQSERRILNTLAAGTLKDDDVMIAHLNRHIGDVLLADIDLMMLKELLVKLVQKDGITQSRLHKLVVKLKKILREALAADIIMRDPTLKLKTPPSTKPKRKSLSVSEAARLLDVLDALPADRNVIAVHIGLATGMRKGEVLGLTWGNVDLTNMAINVTASLDMTKKLKGPKSDAGYRKITLDSSMVARLDEWKSIQAEVLKKHNARLTNDTPVCSNRYGEFCQPSRFYKWFQTFCVNNDFAVFVDEEGNALPKPLLNANGHPVDKDGRCYTRGNKKPKARQFYRGLKFHELRHTQATLLIANGADIKTVQNRLGHAFASMTLDFYAHPVEERDRAATELFSNLLTSLKPKP
ncbi:MAG: site-specific integrase [Coriobacteriales bacterium]|nr:site-specific integrase [Coriobacteriales bacterium]